MRPSVTGRAGRQGSRARPAPSLPVWTCNAVRAGDGPSAAPPAAPLQPQPQTLALRSRERGFGVERGFGRIWGRGGFGVERDWGSCLKTQHSLEVRLALLVSCRLRLVQKRPHD